MKKLLAMSVCVLMSLSMLFGCGEETVSTVSTTATASIASTVASIEVASETVTIDNCKTKDFVKQFTTGKYYMEFKISMQSGEETASGVSKMSVDGENMMLYMEIEGQINHIIIKDGKLLMLTGDEYFSVDYDEATYGSLITAFSKMGELGALLETGTKDGLYFETFRSGESKSTYYYIDGNLEKIEEVTIEDTATIKSLSTDIKVTTTIPSDTFDAIAGKKITKQ